MRTFLCVLGVSVLTMVAPSGVQAGPAWPWASYWDSVCIGDAGGGAGLEFLVITNDYNGNPNPGKTTWIEFLDPGVVLLDLGEPGATVDCEARRITMVSDGRGEARFRAHFGGGSPTGLVEIRASGILFDRVPMRSTDIDGSGVTDLADLSLFAEALFSPSYQEYFDYSLDGAVNIPDLDILRRDIFFGTPGTACP